MPRTCTVQQMHSLAAHHNYEYLGSDKPRSQTKESWLCLTCDTVRQATPNSIQQGTGCPNCYNLRRRVKWEDILALAHARNLILLSNTYEGALKPLRWQCPTCNHIWPASYNSVSQGSGCRKCAGNLPLTVEDMNLIGQQAELIYLGSAHPKSHLAEPWKCLRNNHIWHAAYQNVRTGQRCAHCHHDNLYQRYAITSLSASVLQASSTG